MSGRTSSFSLEQHQIAGQQIFNARVFFGELYIDLARMFHELLSRDRGDGCDTGQPQGVGSEAYLNSTSQGPTPEDARKDGQIHGRSRQLVKYPG